MYFNALKQNDNKNDNKNDDNKNDDNKNDNGNKTKLQSTSNLKHTVYCCALLETQLLRIEHDGSMDPGHITLTT